VFPLPLCDVVMSSKRLIGNVFTEKVTYSFILLSHA